LREKIKKELKKASIKKSKKEELINNKPDIKTENAVI
jgi:hypothetical protein